MASRIENLDRLMKKFERMPERVRRQAAVDVRQEAEGMAAQMRRIAPNDDDPSNGQQVRDHIRVEDGRLGDISAVVISDAKDAKGRPKATRVELGHTAANGVQVPASPSFYPVVRSRKKGIKRRLAASMRKALKAEAAGGS
jgi:hypothetical protein